MSISVSRQSYWTVFYLSLALLYSCTGSDQASNQDQPCQGRCILPAICVESRCVYIPDQELDAHIIDAEVDALIDMDLSCEFEGQQRSCESEVPEQLSNCEHLIQPVTPE